MQERGMSSKRLWKIVMDDTEEVTALKRGDEVVTEKRTIQDLTKQYFEELGKRKEKVPGQWRAGMNRKVGDRREGGESSIVEQDITEEEIGMVCRELENNKAKGGDGIPNEFIKKGGEKLWRVLMKIFNRSSDNSV